MEIVSQRILHMIIRGFIITLRSAFFYYRISLHIAENYFLSLIINRKCL